MAENKKEKTIVERVHDDLQYSSSRYATLFKHIDEDFRFVQGDQWDDKDVQTLKKQGVKALSINKIKPIIKLITGIERQSKSDFVAFPEGEEDNLIGQIATILLKNVSKLGNVARKLSDQFKSGSIGGVSYLEPWIDYSKDLINGIMRFKKLKGTVIYPDPDGKEYDMSDHRFVIKVTLDLSKEELEFLFPEDLKKIEKIGEGKINPEMFMDASAHVQGQDYPPLGSKDKQVDGIGENRGYDLVDYYYKELEDVYSVAVPQKGILKDAPTKEEAEQVASEIEGAVVISRKAPVIKHFQVVGDQVFFDGIAWSYPRWKSYPIIPYFAEYVDDVAEKELAIQGIVRGIKDLQEEFNKRRTQELRHLNSSTNSGLFVPKGALDEANLARAKKFGSSPGIVLEYDAIKGKPEKQFPTPLSQGHAQLAEENSQDLKEASGVNPDLLASSSESQSGRAILLKQRQGLVMLQEMLDNFSMTKKILGNFILTQLKEVYTVESAMRVLGDAFIEENFTVPATIVLERGLKKIQEGKEAQVTELEQSVMLQYPKNSSRNPIVDEKNQLVPMVDFDTAIQTVNQTLNDSELGRYDVSVGEGPFNETVRISNFLALTDLASQGIPIPPAVLIDMSLIPDAEKKKIQEQIAAQQQAAAQQGQAQLQIEQEKLKLQAKGQEDDKSIEEKRVLIDKYEADIKAFSAGVKAQELKQKGKEDKKK